MSLPIEHRLTDLRRTQAWPRLVFAIGTGRLHLDVELAGAKNLNRLGRSVEDQHPEGFAAALAAGLRLGWTPDWVHTVLHDCLAVVLACTGRAVTELTREMLDRFDTELGESMRLSRSSVKGLRSVPGHIAAIRRVPSVAEGSGAPPIVLAGAVTRRRRARREAVSATVRTCRPPSVVNPPHSLPAGCPQAILRPVPMISEPASDVAVA